MATDCIGQGSEQCIVREAAVINHPITIHGPFVLRWDSSFEDATVTNQIMALGWMVLVRIVAGVMSLTTRNSKCGTIVSRDGALPASQRDVAFLTRDIICRRNGAASTYDNEEEQCVISKWNDSG
jgi:hypothetical protein